MHDPKELEAKWQKRWLEERVYEPDLDGAKNPFYNLWMFPYPSAEGLHIGGARTFVGVDILGRYKRMAGFDVFQPVGLDGFGIHSENYALKVGKHPLQHAADSEQNFYRQMHMLGNGYAWDEKLETYDPEYYRWTQWIFTQLFKHGLAYRKKQLVNWCPKDLTVLADEQVENGKCERCGSIVEKKDLEQWFFRITKYADRLLNNIEKLDWSETVKIAQTNWIGRKEGVEITYPIEGTYFGVTVFTTRPDTNFGATFVVLAPEHPLVAQITLPECSERVKNYVEASKAKSDEERIAEGTKKTGVFTGRYATNHLNGNKMPIWVSDFVLAGFGTGAVVGVPGHDLRDFDFAKQFDIDIVRVVIGPDGDHLPILRREQVQEEAGTMVNSGFLNGMDIHDATKAAMDYIEQHGWGKRVVQHRLRDWLISRQRYWGPPIPMIYCEACAAAGKGEQPEMPGWYAVADRDLPVRLPNVENFRPTGTGVSPLAAVKEFYEASCPGCGGMGRRETDVSDTFLDSSWYFLRYPSARDNDAAWDPARTKRWLPVHSYIGGAEHSVLHLLYSRFVTMAFHDFGQLDFEEPFAKFRAHGLITKDGAKMSKSKGNVVNPDEYFGKFGADVMRVHLAFMAPLEQGGDFQDGGILGAERFLVRAEKFVTEQWAQAPEQEEHAETTRLAHKTVKQVAESIERLKLNTGISGLMILLNHFADQKRASKEHLGMFVKMLAPYAPYLTEELWRETMGNKESVHRAPWPHYDPNLIQDERIALVVQVNGKLRDTIETDAGISEEDAKKLALASPKVQQALNGAEPKKIIYIAKKLVNVVI